MSVDVIGLTEIIGTFGKLGSRAQANAEAMMAEVAPQVQAYSQSLAAVDTGYMRDHTLTRAISGARVGFELYCEAYYAIFVELGHHTRSGSFVAARPFLTPAILYGRDLIMARAINILAGGF